MTMIVTRPEYDDTTFYLSEYASVIFDLAGKKGVMVKDFHGEQVTRRNLEKFLSKNTPTLTVLYGHGDENTVYGHDDQILIRAGENDHILGSQIVHTMTCDSARVLGPRSVENGAVSFVGYSDVFIFPFDKNYTAKPLHDGIAKPVLESANHFVTSLLKGNTTGEAYNKSQNTYQKQIELFSRSDAPPEASSILYCLVWNKDHQILHGSLSARV